MKRIYLLLLPFLLTSCIVYPETTVTVIDYSKYTAKGFFITEANSINKEYTPVGSIYASMTAGYGKKDPNDPNLKIANHPEVLELAYKKALELGGNGIINLQLDYTRHGSDSDNKCIITGMVVKIKENPAVSQKE